MFHAIYQLNKIQKDFIWNQKHPKIWCSTLSNTHENGGLKSVHIPKKLTRVKFRIFFWAYFVKLKLLSPFDEEVKNILSLRYPCNFLITFKSIPVNSVLCILKIYANINCQCLGQISWNLLEIFWWLLSNSYATFNLENLNLLSNPNINSKNGVAYKKFFYS